VIDWSDYTVMPGLIDSHDHLGIDLGYEEEQAYEPDFVSLLRSVRNAQTILKSGITTLRTMGEKNFIDSYIKKAIEEGWIAGPRLVNSCQLIAKTGGHCWNIGFEADGVDGLRAGVRKQVKAGADVIKIMVTGGIVTKGSDPRASEYSNEEIIAAIEEAHRCGRKIAAHAHGGPGAKAAIEHGIDSIEHGIYLSEDELILMAEKGTYLVVTYGFMIAALKLAHVPEFIKKGCLEASDHYLKTIELAKRHSVKVAIGGDTWHADPKSELEALLQAGFSHEEALKAGTIGGAELVGMKDKVGAIEVDQIADLIAIKGNPLQNISDVEKVAAVIKEGHLQYVNPKYYSNFDSKPMMAESSIM
jgi:imidazolonepropionase-like amidohydrolase